MKSILVGNGFTSQLIEQYSDLNMKEKLLLTFDKEYHMINELFDSLRVSDYSSKDIYKYSGGLYPSENLFPSAQLYPRADKILYNVEIRQYVINALSNIGFHECNDLFDTYFIQYGLIFEVIKNEINSIENLLKVINMFKRIGKIDEFKEMEIRKIANKIYFNEGKYGLKDTNLKDYSKIKSFFKDFNFIFTTNYDFVLDDICENQDKVFHLHGGFNFEHRNLKTTKRLTDEDAYIVWGINGDEKYNELSPGWDWNDFRWDAVRFDQSLLADYFSSLENNEYDEIHIFGFSGENDQHINKRIIKNKTVKSIYFYCSPDKINDYNYQCKIKELFEGSNANIILEPWTKIWGCIR
jgi:hypothetical protein